MKILIVSEERRYARIVNELRKSNEVDYLFRSTKLKIEKGDYHLPRLFGLHRGFILLVYLYTSFLLLIKRYDVCMTDYVGIYYTNIFPIIKHLTDIIKTSFIFDIRTIPVDYGEHVAKKVEKQFSRKLRFANRYYQGITVITDEMKHYLQRKYGSIEKPVGIWESGVDVNRFKPLEKNMILKVKQGFEEDDFVCFYHGAINSRRGVIELVESFRIVKPRESKIKLFILGSGDSYDKICEIIETYNLQDTVKLHGWVDYAQVPDFISIADLCIVPLPDIDWWRVSSPLKLMEYIACGKNILLTDMVAHTNVVGRNENYFWIREPKPEYFAEGIEESNRCYKNDPHFYYAKGMTEREKFVDKITWERRSIYLMDFITRMIKKT